MTRDDRDVAAFDARAEGYEGGWLGRLRQLVEVLPFPEGSFDLVVSTTSFDHWADQRAGLRECARVLAPGGWLVLTAVIIRAVTARR
jgi:SAM-dependent methyltransferase